MSFNLIVFEASEDGIASVTINRPEKLNALNGALLGELDEVLGHVAGDRSLKGLLLTGAGEKAFVAGADVAELAVGSAQAAEEMSLRGQRIFRQLEGLGKPSLAAINGYALGGGMELALACTVRVASANARLGLPEIRLGIMPGYGGTQRLARLVGRSRALEMLLTGEPVTAAEALQSGLVNHVVPQEELAAFSRELLRKMTAHAPLAAAAILEAVDAGLEGGLEAGLRLEATGFSALATTEDAIEGTRAFLEKRKPAFKGK